MDNIRIYLVDVNKCDRDEQSFDYINASDEQFIEEAENQGLVYSLRGFQDAFKNQEINTATMELMALNIYSISQ
jgi:hypothetical protein